MIGILFAVLLRGDAAAPDSLPRPVVTLPAVEVSRERERLDARRRLPTASVTDLRADAPGRAVLSLSDLLATSAGARVVQYGGMGAFSTLSLRGAPPGQVSVYLDGVPLSSAAHGVVDLASLPAGALDRIEVYRGLSPVEFGPTTPGGAVNLVPADAPFARALHVAAGSFGTWDGRGTLAATRGAWSGLVHGGYTGSRGDFVYHDDNGTPLNPADDRDRTRVNDRFDAVDALARAAWSPGPGRRLAVHVDLLRKAQGVPGPGSVPAPNPRLAVDRALGALEGTFAPREAAPGLTLHASAARERSRFRDSEGELGLGRQDTDERFYDRGTSLELASPRAWRWLTASVGGALRREDAEPAPLALGGPLPAASGRSTRSAYATAQLHLAGDALLLHAARRWDRQRDDVHARFSGGIAFDSDAVRTLNAPQAGAKLRLPRGFEARTNWSKSARAPELLELFGDQGDVLGNPRLRPERAEGWDAGLAWHGRVAGARVTLDGARYATHERDLIAFWPASQRSTRAVNVTRAELRGEEYTLGAERGPLALSATTAWVSALQTDAGSIYYGRQLPQRPQRQDWLRAELHGGPWRASIELLALGRDYLDPINFDPVPARSLLGASLARELGVLRVTLEGRNLGDQRAEDVAGYPLPGRSVFLALDLDGAARP